MTSNPEEKRKIIGDVFVKVSLFVWQSSSGHQKDLNIKLGVEHSWFAAGHCALLLSAPHFVSVLWLLILNLISLLCSSCSYQPPSSDFSIPPLLFVIFHVMFSLCLNQTRK
jgi:hypothetical protein